MSSPIPTLTPVTRSSTIEAVGHDPATLTLVVQFKTGARYSYVGVPSAIVRDMLAAASIGSYFARVIKSNPKLYRCTKLDTPPVEAQIPSFYDDQPVDTILADAAHTVQRIVGGDREYVYPLLEHLAALLVARDDVFLRDIATMGAYIRQARRALGLMPRVES